MLGCIYTVTHTQGGMLGYIPPTNSTREAGWAMYTTRVG